MSNSEFTLQWSHLSSKCDALRGTQLKRVVITSSCASVFDSNSRGLVNESSWNEASVTLVKEKGSAAPNPEKYRASKTLAERGK